MNDSSDISNQVFCASPWVPPEWIAAYGFEPRGIWSDRQFGLELGRVTAGICLFAQSVVGWAERVSNVSRQEKIRPAGLILSSHCDQMRRAFDHLAVSSPMPLFLFNVPATWRTPVAERMLTSELERLGRFLIGRGGQPPSPEKLGEIIAKYNDARRQLLEAAPRWASWAFAQAVAQFYWSGAIDVPQELYPAQARSIPNDINPGCLGEPALPGRALSPKAPLPGTLDLPLALVGGPLLPSDWGLLEAIERAGARVALNATETGELALLPELGLNGLSNASPHESARGYLTSCRGVFQRPNTRLYAWLGAQLAARNARGIILWHYVACDLWRAEATHLREAFGLPLLQIDADQAQGCSTRAFGRIQAFIELLQQHRQVSHPPAGQKPVAASEPDPRLI